MTVRDKVYLVTGAGRGQGEAHARLLTQRGAAVTLFDVPSAPVSSIEYSLPSRQDLDRIVDEIKQAGGRAHAVYGDVRSQDDLDRAAKETISEFGTIDGLVANAGIWGELARIWEMSEQTWLDTVDINLSGTFRAIKAVAPTLIDKRSGSIVLISSVVGLSEGMACGSTYTAAKQGIIGLMATAAQELGEFEVRVNAVCPGFIDTGMHRWQKAMDLMAGHPGGSQSDLDQAGRHYQILPRPGLQAADVSQVVAFLLSDESHSMTGSTIPVDAGHTVLPRVNQSPVIP